MQPFRISIKEISIKINTRHKKEIFKLHSRVAEERMSVGWLHKMQILLIFQVHPQYFLFKCSSLLCFQDSVTPCAQQNSGTG